MEEAERALTNENYQKLNGKEFRLMWQIKDAKVVNKFNIIVKHLPSGIESKDLGSEFSPAGSIFSCKIPETVKNSEDP